MNETKKDEVIDKVELKKRLGKELLARRDARKNLESFYKYTFDDFVPGEHITQICDALDRVEKGECKRLIISLPPRHSKSETSSVRFPAWFLGKHPTKRIVLASYSESLAAEQSRKCKAVFTSDKYELLFPATAPHQLNKTYKTADKEWQTFQRGDFYSVGVGGGLTGRGFDIGIIDDFVKDRQEANSDLCKERVKSWYQSTFYTRAEPDAAIIIIATRWAVDDLIGFLIEEEKSGGEQWEKISMPAVDEDNNPLWPARFDYKKLMKIKKSVGNFEWSALYQGRPTLRHGNRFIMTNVNVHKSAHPFPHAIYMRAWDLASSAKERDSDDPDYTVGVLATIIKNANGLDELWIKDIVYGRWEAPKRDAIIQRTAVLDGPRVRVYVEAFGAYKDAYTTLKRILSGKNIVSKSLLPGDKSIKAAGLEPIFEAGNVHIIDKPWTDIFIKQFTEFPYSKHDDVVDACSIIFGEHKKAKSGLMIIP